MNQQEVSATTQSARIMARLPRLVTEVDDESWIGLGEALMAVLSPDDLEEAYPEGTAPMKLDGLVRMNRAVAQLDVRITELSRPEGEHRYLKGGIHADVSECGACGRLHAYRAVLSWLVTPVQP